MSISTTKRAKSGRGISQGCRRRSRTGARRIGKPYVVPVRKRMGHPAYIVDVTAPDGTYTGSLTAKDEIELTDLLAVLDELYPHGQGWKHKLSGGLKK